MEALPKHARDVHEWERERCDFHPLRVCMCLKCEDKENIKCTGKPYKTRLRLDCEFRALLYEIECTERAAQASKLVHPILKRGHSNAVEASHNVLIRFRSKDIFLERLHYQLSTNLGLLQANMTYMHAKFGVTYHWLPELYRHMKLPIFEGIVEALEKHNMRRKRRLDLAKTTPQKKRWTELKKKRVVEGRERIKWSKKNGQDTYYGGCSDSGDSGGGKMVCDSGDGVNQNKGKGKDSSRGKGKSQGKGKCAACGSSTHQRSSHKDCPFRKSRAKKGAHPDHTAEEVIPASETGEDTSNGDSSDSQESEIDSCTCGAEGRAHKRGCPLSYRNHLPPGHALFPAPSNPRAHADPSVLEPEVPQRVSNLSFQRT